MIAQNDTKWDDRKNKEWPEECREISITSSLDGAEQKAMFYATKNVAARPLVVSLHTWSGDYLQKDTLSWMCIEKGYNYIHPNFRGPNNRFEACGSPLVIKDIDDAISYALKNANVDTNEIHIIGVSGGGHATLLAYMKTRHPVKTFSAWVPISNLETWFLESEGRNNKYARDIALSTTGKDFGQNDYYIDTMEARKRSPVFMPTPVKDRKNARLSIYAGIHDGYTGSVPITQSILFYNKVVKDFDSTLKKAVIPDEDIITLVSARNYPSEKNQNLGARKIHYQKKYRNIIEITIFEGTHEMLTETALNPLND